MQRGGTVAGANPGKGKKKKTLGWVARGEGEGEGFQMSHTDG